VKELSRARREWLQRKFGGKQFLTAAAHSTNEPEKVNAYALGMVDDADQAICEAHEARVRFGYFSMAIIVNHPDAETADAMAEEVRKYLGRSRIAANIEDMNAVDAFLGSLPGDGYHNVRRPVLSMLNLADIMPTTSIWAGPRKNPCPMYPPDTPPLITASTVGVDAISPQSALRRRGAHDDRRSDRVRQIYSIESDVGAIPARPECTSVLVR
jgi:type IV secretion system protein TrbE